MYLNKAAAGLLANVDALVYLLLEIPLIPARYPVQARVCTEMQLAGVSNR